MLQSARAKKASYFKILYCPQRDLDFLEKYYIGQLRPTRNKVLRRKKAEAFCFSIQLDDDKTTETDIYELHITINK